MMRKYGNLKSKRGRKKKKYIVIFIEFFEGSFIDKYNVFLFSFKFKLLSVKILFGFISKFNILAFSNFDFDLEDGDENRYFL